MPQMNEAGQRVLYAIVCGAPPARDVGKLVDLAQADGWDVCVIASPDGRNFIDVPALEAKTGHSVRSLYKQPDTADELPPPDAMIVATRSVDGGPSHYRRVGHTTATARTETVPVFTAIRSTKEEPDFVPAASPRLPRSTSPWPPTEPPMDQPGVPRPRSRLAGRPAIRCAPLPAHIRQVRGRFGLEGL
jgi:hypothetical protein